MGENNHFYLRIFLGLVSLHLSEWMNRFRLILLMLMKNCETYLQSKTSVLCTVYIQVWKNTYFMKISLNSPRFMLKCFDSAFSPFLCDTKIHSLDLVEKSKSRCVWCWAVIPTQTCIQRFIVWIYQSNRSSNSDWCAIWVQYVFRSFSHLQSRTNGNVLYSHRWWFANANCTDLFHAACLFHFIMLEILRFVTFLLPCNTFNQCWSALPFFLSIECWEVCM